MADTYLTYPYEFQGGRKAVASQVNANFEAVKQFANGINVSLAELRTAISDLKNKPTREMLDVFYSFSAETPAGAYPLWTGETIHHCKSLYPQFWKKLTNMQQMGTVVTVSEEEYTNRLTTYNQCAAFFIDELNGHIRLPKISKFISSIEDLTELAKEENAGLPNITGEGSWAYLNTVSGSGAIYSGTGASHQTSSNGNTHNGTARLMFNAERSNKIYGASDTVQPPAVKLCLYLQVANNLAEISELNTQAIAEQLEGALDKLAAASQEHHQQLTELYNSIKVDLLNASTVVKIMDFQVLPENFTADEQFTDYPYCACLPINQAEPEMVPSVTLALAEAQSGNFAPVAECGDGFVRIFAKAVPEAAFNIPSIVLQ